MSISIFNIPVTRRKDGKIHGKTLISEWMKGQKFGKLTAICRFSKVKTKTQNKWKWLCQCECGNYVAVMGYSLRRGKTKTCGCDGRGRKSIRFKVA